MRRTDSDSRQPFGFFPCAGSLPFGTIQADRAAAAKMPAGYHAQMKRIRVFVLFSAIAFFTASAASSPPLFWEQSISRALSARDAFYERLGLGHRRQPLLSIVTELDSAELAEKLQRYARPDSPWPHLIAGLNLVYSAPSQADTHFTNALRTCEGDAGLSWVLFSEFDQISQPRWAEESLRQLEKIFLASGSQAVPVIAQQLLTSARKGKQSSGSTENFDYWDWSGRFERNALWQRIGKAQSLLPGQPLMALNELRHAVTMLAQSWDLQLSAAYYAYRWFRLAAALFVIMTIAALAIRSLPAGLHGFADLLPESIPPGVRHALIIISFCSLAFLGIVPFLLATVIIIWPRLRGRERIAGAVCGVALALLPLDARIRTAFIESLSPANTLGLYRQSFDSGYTSELESVISDHLNANRNDYLSYVSASILALKKGNPRKAIRLITIGEEFKPNDPVVLLTAGNAYFLAGNLEKAGAYYRRCRERHPRLAAAAYNLGQFHLASMQTVDGTRLIQTAADKNRMKVNRFIDKNDAYFFNQWPPLRRIMTQDYKPGYFWLHVFGSHSGSWKSANALWSSQFWGAPIVASAVAGPVLIAVFFAASVSRSRRRVRRIFFCKLCGMPMCRACRVSRICAGCRERLRSLGSEEGESESEKHIERKTRFIAHTKTAILDALFPGLGSLSSLNNNRVKALLLTAATAVVYGAYGMLFTVRFAYPFWIVRGYFTFALIGLVSYTIYFAARAAARYWRRLHAEGFLHGAQR